MAEIAAGKYESGIAHLERAYDILPHPNVLYNIAVAYVSLGDKERAIEYFERYRDTAPAAGAVEVAATLRELRQSVAAQSASEPAVAAPAASETPAGRLDAASRLEALAADLRSKSEAQNDPALRVQADQLESLAAQMRSEVPAESRGERSSPEVTSTSTTPTSVSVPAPPKTQVSQDVYEERVESASRFAQSPLDAPNATAIITAQDIRLTGLTNLNELLRRVAGVEVTSVAPNHADIGIRGLNRRTSNKVMLLLNGRSLRQEFLGTGWYDFLPISLEDVERIEIIRGPASALYGADAFSGIINIITRAPGEGTNFIVGGVGNHDQSRGVASFTGRQGNLSYHFGTGYLQADSSVLAVAKDRVDFKPLSDTPDITNKHIWANGEMRYLLGKSVVTAGGNVVYGDQMVQGLSRLLQVTVDDIFESQAYASLQTPVGLRLSTFWNHMDGGAGISYVEAGAIDVIARNAKQEIADVDLSWTGNFDLLVPQTVTVGGGYRFKSIRLNWLDADHTQNHYAAYVQDVLELAKPLRLQVGARVDRHPLLSNLQFSPRASLVYRFREDQSLRLSAGRAFRGPSFLESYVEFPNAAPLRGVSAWGVGNRHLDPESINSVELGYQNQASDYFAFEANAYFNLVKDAILFTNVRQFGITDFAQDTGSHDLSTYDPNVNAFPISSLQFVNERATFRQLGGELGARVYPLKGLDVFTNYAIHDTSPMNKKDIDPVRAKEQQTSLHKINAGVQYRAPFGLDTSVDMSWTSRQVWIEQVTDVNRGVRFETFNVDPFVMVHARVGYRLFADRLELGVIGTNLAHQTQRQHPFGQPLDTRVMGVGKLRF